MLVCFFDSLIYNVGGRRSLLFFGFGGTGFLLHSPQCRPSETQLIGNGVVVVLEQPLHLRNALHNGLRGAAGGVLQGRVFLPQLFQKLVLANGLDEELPLDAGGGVHGLPVEVDIPLDHRRKGDEVGGPGIEPEQLVQFFPELFLPAQRDRARLPPHRKDPEQLDHIIAPLPERRKGKGKDREHLPQLPGEAARLFRLQQGDDAGLEHLEGCAAHAEERVVDQHLSQAGEERLGRAAQPLQDDGAIARQLKQTRVVVGALLAAKEGAGGILPHHRGIDHHKGLAGVGRALVDALGKKALAGAALAKDHDVFLGLGQLFPRRHSLGDGHRIAHKVFPLVPGHKFLGIRRLFPAAAVRQHGNEHSHLAVALLELSLHTAHHGTVEQVDVVGLDLAALIKRVIRERGNQLAQLQAPELAALQAHQSFCLLVERGNAVVLIGDDDARRHVPDQRIGNRYESTYPYDTFPAKDGDVVIAAGNNKLYAILCDVMGKPELKTDPRFAEVKDRVANHVAMREIIVPWTKQHTIDEVDKLLNDAGCPSCPVNTLDRLVVDPQIAGARGMFPTIDQPGIGELQITAIPAHTTRTSTAPRKAAPLLGEDNADVYGKLLGLDEAKLADLKAKGVI